MRKADTFSFLKPFEETSCVDLFCGAGGLTHGFILEGLNVVAGIDVDPACKHPFVHNNGARFLLKDVRELSADELSELFLPHTIKILVGCAPCQPFSTYRLRYGKRRDEKWGLLYEFARLIEGTKPELVSMENVPSLKRYEIFKDFVRVLEDLGYHVWYDVVESANYGVPQTRKRLVLLASRFGPIAPVPPTHSGTEYETVRKAIGHLPPIRAGEAHPTDPLHVSPRLTPLNLRRIRASRPGGTWKDWPRELIAKCHLKVTGRSYPSIYGRMEWDKPAPTLTTQFYNYGSGRFGHPEQDRAISLREGALLQSFPHYYEFVPSGERVEMTKVGRLIGNAVPVKLARAIARSIIYHLMETRLLSYTTSMPTMGDRVR